MGFGSVAKSGDLLAKERHERAAPEAGQRRKAATYRGCWSSGELFVQKLEEHLGLWELESSRGSQGESGPHLDDLSVVGLDANLERPSPGLDPRVDFRLECLVLVDAVGGGEGGHDAFRPPLEHGSGRAVLNQDLQRIYEQGWLT